MFAPLFSSWGAFLSLCKSFTFKRGIGSRTSQGELRGVPWFLQDGGRGILVPLPTPSFLRFGMVLKFLFETVS